VEPTFGRRRRDLAQQFQVLNELNFHYTTTRRADYYVSIAEDLRPHQPLEDGSGSDDFTDGKDPLEDAQRHRQQTKGWNIAGDAVYTITPTTVLDIRGSFYKVEDKRDYRRSA